MQIVPVVVCNDSINTQCHLIYHVKAERSDIHGYGDTDIVGIYMRLFSLLLCIADGFCACSEQKKEEKRE